MKNNNYDTFFIGEIYLLAAPSPEKHEHVVCGELTIVVLCKLGYSKRLDFRIPRNRSYCNDQLVHWGILTKKTLNCSLGAYFKGCSSIINIRLILYAVYITYIYVRSSVSFCFDRILPQILSATIGHSGCGSIYISCEADFKLGRASSLICVLTHSSYGYVVWHGSHSDRRGEIRQVGISTSWIARVHTRISTYGVLHTSLSVATIYVLFAAVSEAYIHLSV